ncbi:MAG: peptide ABC transporter permease [Chloroflexi bacterium 13_1_40CM_3_65_12]|nr:MAG: peptide ABC transporter permease [Chloroflexi bacterium 13_1_40CM_65_17]OLC48837.1 MAG: peptide ABC transporter permease [Chloroflexi bacterium 13_1_40CM_4_65_13]OLD24673.1 MAG: peptide ABC transporter permease [Chloroflexi bacterium 13_1_40CM_3_65_12]OLD46825.1 MAG: peptide ABC transporter permease [Chloroflexi bacterium 13_1_40CM_2_68_14]
MEQLGQWEVPEQQIGLWSDALQRFRRNRLAIAGAAVVLLLVLIAFGSPLLVQLHLIADPLKQHVEFIEAAPGQNGYAFGADELGRDTLSRLLFGSRVSLAVGIFVQAIILPIGLAIGLTAGYFGGRIDNLLMRFTDIWYAFPDLLFVLVVVSVFGPSLLTIFGAIALVNWVGLARLVRGQVLSIKEKEFIEAARSSGSAPAKLILKHLLPNSLGPIIVTLTFGIPQAIFLEAVLSFLGVGIQPPTPTWGQMVFDGYENIYANPTSVVFPALAIGFTLLAFSFVGDGLRDALDPRMKR